MGEREERGRAGGRVSRMWLRQSMWVVWVEGRVAGREERAWVRVSLVGRVGRVGRCWMWERMLWRVDCIMEEAGGYSMVLLLVRGLVCSGGVAEVSNSERIDLAGEAIRSQQGRDERCGRH